MRHRMLVINPAAIVNLAKYSSGPRLTVRNPLPIDARMVNTIIQQDHLLIVVESEKFDDIPEGNMMPQHHIDIDLVQ